LKDYLGGYEDTSNTVTTSYNLGTETWQSILPLDKGFSSFKLITIDGSTNKNADTTIFKIFQGVPLVSISDTIWTIVLDKDNPLVYPKIDWNPPNTTDKRYILRNLHGEVETDTSIIIFLDNQRAIARWANDVNASTVVELVPLADTTKTILLPIIVEKD